MYDDFYRIFEEKFYAPREKIKELRKQYLPFIEPLVKIYPSGKIFDVGCGRGEWLELMQKIGFKPYGVDLDDGMLQSCKELNLPASKGDAIAFLKTLESESHIVISAFHVVEHIPFDALHTLVSEAMRVLKPGGLLIIETPNPENLKVSTLNFYLDPTHIRPIPPQLLSFLPEYYGFYRVKTIRLQESAEMPHKKKISLLDVLAGASPDYAVIAQKKADDNLLESFDSIFDKEYGINMENLALRFQNCQLPCEIILKIKESIVWKVVKLFRNKKNQ